MTLLLDPEQRRQVERMAREQGVRCSECGSRDLTADYKASGGLGDHGADVWLECTDRHIQEIFNVPYDKAVRLGILKDLPP